MLLPHYQKIYTLARDGNVALPTGKISFVSKKPRIHSSQTTRYHSFWGLILAPAHFWGQNLVWFFHAQYMAAGVSTKCITADVCCSIQKAAEKLPNNSNLIEGLVFFCSILFCFWYLNRVWCGTISCFCKVLNIPNIMFVGHVKVLNHKFYTIFFFFDVVPKHQHHH